jgi:predicted nucleotidyltransferase
MKSTGIGYNAPGRGVHMIQPWQVTHEKVKAAIDKIVAVSQPRKIILFGSYVHGMLRPDSDLDVLVVTMKPVDNPRRESVRIRRELKGISMPMDILVISEDRLQELAEVPGLIYREALRSGKVAYESAA